MPVGKKNVGRSVVTDVDQPPCPCFKIVLGKNRKTSVPIRVECRLSHIQVTGRHLHPGDFPRDSQSGVIGDAVDSIMHIGHFTCTVRHFLSEILR